MVVLPFFSGTALTAATRPLIAAEPMLRAFKPEIAPLSKVAAVSAAKAPLVAKPSATASAKALRRWLILMSLAPLVGCGRLRTLRGKREYRILDRHVRLRLVYADLHHLIGRAALGSGGDREREIDAV